MTTSEPTTAFIPARWAPDPGVRGQLRFWDGTRWTPHTVDALTASRPELPSWFRSATRWLYAACGLIAVACLSVFALATWSSTPTVATEAAQELAMTGVTVLVLLTGAWAYTVAESRRVDRSALQHSPVWLWVAWFIPIVHVVFPFQFFGEIWASARRKRTGRGRAAAATSLVGPRPWVIRAWAWAWAFSSGGLLLLCLVGVELEAVMAWLLVANAVMAALLAGVVRVIARELDSSEPSGTTVIP